MKSDWLGNKHGYWSTDVSEFTTCTLVIVLKLVYNWTKIVHTVYNSKSMNMSKESLHSKFAHDDMCAEIDFKM